MAIKEYSLKKDYHHVLKEQDDSSAIEQSDLEKIVRLEQVSKELIDLLRILEKSSNKRVSWEADAIHTELYKAVYHIQNLRRFFDKTF